MHAGVRALGLLLLAALAWPAADGRTQEAAPEAGAAPTGADDLIREIRRLEVLQRLDTVRAAVTDDAEGDEAEQVRREIGERLGMDVLDVETVEVEGQQVFAVRVMAPPGNFNDAFMVSVVLVDPVSGDILGQAPVSAGLSHSLSPGSDGLPNEGLEIRRRTYR